MRTRLELLIERDRLENELLHRDLENVPAAEWVRGFLFGALAFADWMQGADLDPKGTRPSLLTRPEDPNEEPH